MEQYPRGILKSSPNYKGKAKSKKIATFDESNILMTLHPPDKDYGFIAITEAKTPFAYDSTPSQEKLDPEVLMQRLRIAAKGQDEDIGASNEDYSKSLEEKVRRLEFERRRKAHYKEFDDVPMARRLIAKEQSEIHKILVDEMVSEGSDQAAASILDSIEICEDEYPSTIKCEDDGGEPHGAATETD